MIPSKIKILSTNKFEMANKKNQTKNELAHKEKIISIGIPSQYLLFAARDREVIAALLTRARGSICGPAPLCMLIVSLLAQESADTFIAFVFINENLF